MSGEISTSLLPFVSHQAVAVILIIENSCAMACDWPNVRDRYVRTMVESLKAANTTVPMELKVLPTLPVNADHTSSPNELCEYNDLKDLQFNHSPDNRLSARHVHRGIECLLSSDVGKLPSTVRHIFIVAATPPSESFADEVGTGNKPEVQTLAERLTEAHIYHHLIANASQDMTHLHTLFEETLRLQGNVENKAHVRPWNGSNAQVYAVRLASRTQVQICATTAVRGKPYTAGLKGKEAAGRLPISRQGSPNREAPKPSGADVEKSPSTPNRPGLVAHLQKIHGLVKKKVHSIPPPRPPFFRDDPVHDKELSSTPSLGLPAEIVQLEPKSDGGRVQSQFKVDRSSRVRGKGTRSRSHSTATPLSPPSRKATDLSCITKLMDDQPQTGSRSNSKLHPTTSTAGNSSPLSPSVTDAMDNFSLHSHPHASIPHNINNNVLDSLSPIHKEKRTVFLPVPAYPSLTTVLSSLQADQNPPPHAWSPISSTGFDPQRPSPAQSSHAMPRSLIPEADLSELTNDEAFMRQTRSIIAKMTPDQGSGDDDVPRRSLSSTDSELVHLPHSRASGDAALNQVQPATLSLPALQVGHPYHDDPSRPPTPVIVELTGEAHSEWDAAAEPAAPDTFVVKTPSVDDLSRQMLQAGYWHDMALLFGPNNPNPGIEGLPRYPVADLDNGHVVDLDVSGSMLFPTNNATLAPVDVGGNPTATNISSLTIPTPSNGNDNLYSLGATTTDIPPSYATSVDSFPRNPPHDSTTFDMNNESMLSLLGYLHPPAPSYQFLTDYNSEASLGFDPMIHGPDDINPIGESPRWRFGS